MAMRRQIARGGLLALGISVVAVLAFAWGHVNPDGAQADADGPAMSLSAPGTVYMGETFVLTIMSDPAPDVEIAGLGSEVIWVGPDQENPRDGLKWEQRDNCADDPIDPLDTFELQVERADGGAIALCSSFSPALTSGAGIAVLSEFALPAAALDVDPGSTTPLVEFDFVCNTAGSYKLTLTAVPGSPDGALFGGLDGTELRVKTVEQDTIQVADTLTIECSDEPPPTDTPEPTDIPPTDVPPTDTPEATVEPTIGGPDDGVAGGAGDSGANGGLWVLIGALLAASVAGMTIFGWRYVRVQ